MRLLRRNKLPLKYSMLIQEIDIYETDIYGNVKYDVDIDGNSYPIKTGDKELLYTEPIDFFGRIADAEGDAEAKEFGVDTSDYEATMLLAKGTLPIDEKSIIWRDSEPEYKYADPIEVMNEETGETIETRVPLWHSADYHVKKIAKSLNVDRYLLKSIAK